MTFRSFVFLLYCGFRATEFLKSAKDYNEYVAGMVRVALPVQSEYSWLRLVAKEVVLELGDTHKNLLRGHEGESQMVSQAFIQ